MACACSADAPGDETLPEVIRVGVLPDQSPENLKLRHRPLLAYLSDATDMRFELVIPKDYDELVRQFEERDIDLAWFGGFTFVQAEMSVGAAPIVLRDIDLRFTSCYLVKPPGERSSVEQFEGATFAFGPTMSTSGHLMPRYYMSQQGLAPEAHFASVRHSIGHDQTAKWVADGTIELGVANCVIVQSMLATGQLSADEIKILDTTPPYSDYVWAAGTTMNELTRNTILAAFLELDATVPEHRKVLQLQGAEAYLPAGSEDFDAVRNAVEQTGLLDTKGKR